MSSPSVSSNRALVCSWALSCRLGLACLLVPCLPACRTVDAGTSLRIEVPADDRDADLYVDGLYVGQVSAVGQEPVGPVMLAPGVHRVEVRKPGRFPVQRTVRVGHDTPAETVVQAELLEDPQ